MKTWGEHGIVSLMEPACGALWVVGCSLAAAGYWLFCPVFRCCRSLLSHINYGIKKRNSNPSAFEAPGHFSRLHFAIELQSLSLFLTPQTHRTQCALLQNVKRAYTHLFSCVLLCALAANTGLWFSLFSLMTIFMWHFIAAETPWIIESPLSNWSDLYSI